MNEDEVDSDDNVVILHVVYKIKTDETGTRFMKARLVPYGNEDDMKESIRKYFANAQLSIIRLLLSLTTFRGFAEKTADIKGAYLQSGSIKRSIYIRPPQEWHMNNKCRKGTLWKLIKLPYGIVEAGRYWTLTVEHWMLTIAGLNRTFGIGHLFVKRNGSGRIILVVAKVSEEFMVAGTPNDTESFMCA